MKTSENINEIAKAMSLAQKEMKPALLDSSNPYFGSKYSNLLSIWKTISEPLTNNGLSIVQDALTLEKHISITTRISHESGQWMEFGPLLMPSKKIPRKNDPELLRSIEVIDAQSIGSAISYARRYALCAALCIVSGDPEEDDDGNSVSKVPETKIKQNKSITKPVEKKDDINHPDVQTFLSRVDNKEQFIKYMYETMKIYKWETELQAIKEFKNNIEITKQAFEDWVKNKT